MFAELRGAIAQAVLAGGKLDAIERQIINPAALDDEQKAALWLYAEAVAHRPARLLPAASSRWAVNHLLVGSEGKPKRVSARGSLACSSAGACSRSAASKSSRARFEAGSGPARRRRRS